MPVGNQWRARAGRSATVSEESPPAAKDPEPTGPHGKRIGRLQNFRTKSQDAGGKSGEPSQPGKDGADGERPSSGKKSLGEKWSAASTKDEGRTVRKKRLEVTEDGDSSAAIVDPANVGIILENEPIRLEGVVRSDDPSEFTKPLEVEKGFAKNLANLFLQQQDATSTAAEPRRFKMDVALGAPEVHENEPVRLEGVVRSGDRTEDVIGKRGTIKSIAGRFASRQAPDSESSDESSEEEDPRRRRPAPPRRSVTARRDTGGSDPTVLSENVPAELDPSIARGTDGYRANDPVMESGRTRSMAERWRQQQEQDVTSGGDRSSKPAWLVELENAKESEYGVFENEPEVRDDVVRADDDTPDVISVQHTRSLRQMWTQIERDRDQPQPQPGRPPPVRQKEPSPEPPKPPPEEPKPRFGRRPIGRLQGFGHLQKEEPPAPAAAAAGKPGDGKGARGKAASTASAAQPAPVEASKLYVKPSLKPIQKKK